MQEYQQLTEGTEESYAVLNNSPAPIHFVDSHGTILWANKTELKLFGKIACLTLTCIIGYDEDEFIGKNFLEFVAKGQSFDTLFGILNN